METKCESSLNIMDKSNIVIQFLNHRKDRRKKVRNTGKIRELFNREKVLTLSDEGVILSVRKVQLKSKHFFPSFVQKLAPPK